MARRRTRRTKTGPGFWVTLVKRPTGELLVLALASTVCGSIVVGGTAIIVLAFVNPDVDVSFAATKITGLLNTIVGLMAGFLAGRTDIKYRPPPEDEDKP